MTQQSDTLRAIYMRYWRTWLSPHWRKILVSFLFMAIMSLAAGAYTAFTQQVVLALQEVNREVLLLAPGALVLLTLVRGGSSYIRNVLIYGLMAEVEARMQQDMFGKLINADMAVLQTEASASLAARFNADVRIAQLAATTALGLVANVLIIASTLAFMLSINWQMTVTFLAVLLLAVWPVLRIGARLRILVASNQAEIATMTARVNEGLSGIRLVKTYRLEDRLEATAKEIFQSLRRLLFKQSETSARMEPLVEVLGGLAIAALLLVIALAFTTDGTVVADFVGLLTGMGLIVPQAQRLGKVYASLQQGAAALQRIYGVLDEPDHIISEPGAAPLKLGVGRIVFRAVGFRYPDGTAALRDFDLTIEPGQKVAFVGRSGAGKSTVFNLLPRLYDVTEGAVEIDGQNIRDVSIASLRDAMAMVSQDSVLLSGTVMDNIRFGRPGASDAEVRAAAESASAAEFIERLPSGFDTVLSPDGGSFSGGERQRLSIARAILRNAPILLLDEPTSALDAQSEAAVRGSLARLMEGRTTLVIAHRLSTILDADRIVVMDGGRMVETGTHVELLARGGYYAELFQLQFTDG